MQARNSASPFSPTTALAQARLFTNHIFRTKVRQDLERCRSKQRFHSDPVFPQLDRKFLQESAQLTHYQTKPSRHPRKRLSQSPAKKNEFQREQQPARVQTLAQLSPSRLPQLPMQLEVRFQRTAERIVHTFKDQWRLCPSRRRELHIPCSMHRFHRILPPTNRPSCSPLILGCSL